MFWSRIAALCIFTLLWSGNLLAASAVTGVRLVSTTGDYIGGGQNQTFLPAKWSFSENVTTGYVDIAVSGSTYWDFEFSAPSGSALEPGDYAGAQRYPFNSPKAPGLSVSGDGRGCNTLSGWFEVLEYQTDSFGKLLKLAINFKQNCEESPDPLYGAVRYNSSYPLAVPNIEAIADADSKSIISGQTVSLDGSQSFLRTLGKLHYQWTQTAGAPVTLSDETSSSPYFVGPTVSLAGDVLTFQLTVTSTAGQSDTSEVSIVVSSADTPRTAVTFYGDSGDYITGGNSYSYDLNNSVITFSRNYDGGVSLSISGDTWWYIDTATPSGVTYAPGTYDNAERYPFQSPTAPGLSLDGDGRGCNTLTGNFVVHQAQFDSLGTPQVLDVTFEQHCEGGVPAAYGEFLLNAVPASVRAAAAKHHMHQ